MLRRLLPCCAGLIVMLVLVWPGSGQRPAVAQGTALTPAAPPAGTEGLGATWYTVATPEGRTVLLAVYDPRPAPDQARPAILVLHGSHGFATQYVQIARDLAAQTGYVSAAGCWFDGAGQDADTSAIAPIRCPGGPEFVGATEGAWPAVQTLGQAVQQYAGAAGLGIFGHSRGAEVALQLASSPDPSGTGIQGVVASSGIYTAAPGTASYDSPTPLSLAAGISAPVLILHGQADAEARFSNAALYYARLQSLGKPAQCVVYPGVGHDAILETEPGAAEHRIFTDGVQRSAAFFRGIFSEFSALQVLDCVPG